MSSAISLLDLSWPQSVDRGFSKREYRLRGLKSIIFLLSQFSKHNPLGPLAKFYHTPSLAAPGTGSDAISRPGPAPPHQQWVPPYTQVPSSSRLLPVLRTTSPAIPRAHSPFFPALIAGRIRVPPIGLLLLSVTWDYREAGQSWRSGSGAAERRKWRPEPGTPLGGRGAESVGAPAQVTLPLRSRGECACPRASLSPAWKPPWGTLSSCSTLA